MNSSDRHANGGRVEMRCPALVGFLAVIFFLPSVAQDWRQPLRIAESVDGAIVVDGVLKTTEWEDALTVPGSDPCEIRLKRYGGFLFVGVWCPDLELPVLDLFLNPSGEDVYQLHVAAYLAERKITDAELVEPLWAPDVKLDWSANVLEWNTTVADSLVALGVHGQEMLHRAVVPYEGFEVRIGEEQFNSVDWQMQVQVSRFAGDDILFAFPPKPRLGGVENGWLLLHLSSPDIPSESE